VSFGEPIELASRYGKPVFVFERETQRELRYFLEACIA